MRAPVGLWLVASAVGCYSPTFATGIPCAAEGTEARCPADQVCVLRNGMEVCAPAGSSSDVDAAVLDDAPDAMIDATTDSGVPIGWWNPTWTRRRPIDITAGANGAPAGYSVSIVLDHAALVGGSASLASGNDVRIVRDSDGVEIDRALDSGAAWGTSSTRIWFKTEAAIGANATVRYWVYFGNATAGAPPQSPASVFLLADGFEGSVAAWELDTGVAVSTTRAHRGTKSIVMPAVAGMDRGAWTDTIDEANLAFDLWWNIDDTTDADMSQLVRGTNTSVWMTNLQPPATSTPSTWDIASDVDGTFSEVVPPPTGAASPPADTWFRVTMYAYQTMMAVDVGGTRYVPASGFSNIGSTTSGSIGFSVWTTPAQVWFDDATVRRFVLPEPAVVLGAQQML